jgi:cytochrome c biogenesis protein CcdA
MIFARLGEMLDRLFARLAMRPRKKGNGGFILGPGLGLVCVPCAGPVLTAIAVAGATRKLSLNVVILTCPSPSARPCPCWASPWPGGR